WYRRVFDAPPGWKESLITLHFGGARVEAWVWLNGSLLTHHLGHSVPFEVGLNQSLRPGALNTLLIALDNTSEDEEGTSLRGYQGRSAGLYRPVSLKITGGTRIKSCYLRPAKERQRILWTVDLEGKDLGRDILLHWRIETQGGRLLGQS